MSTAIDAVYAKLAADGRTAADLETLCRALPPRGERDAHHIAVAVAISQAYRTQLEPAHKIQTCRSLAREIRECVGADGRYVAPHGEPLELVGTRCDVITSELEWRHGCDFLDLWEAAGGSV